MPVPCKHQGKQRISSIDVCACSLLMLIDRACCSAARLLLSKKIHRLPVVDAEGKLVGVLSRGNLVKAALAVRRAASQ